MRLLGNFLSQIFVYRLVKAYRIKNNVARPVYPKFFSKFVFLSSFVGVFRTKGNSYDFQENKQQTDGRE